MLSRSRQAPALVLAAAALALLLGFASSASADPSVSSKQEQARAIMAQIESEQQALEQQIEAYNLARIQLADIDAELESNGKHLVVARKSLSTAQVRIAKRLRALYINGGGGGAVEVILGAESLDDLLARLDVAQRVGQQDAKVLREVKRFGREVKIRRAKLASARKAQAALVAEQAEKKQYIEGRIAEQNRMLASVKDEIAKIRAAEAARQAQLAAQARARLAAQQAAQAAAATQVAAAPESTPVSDDSGASGAVAAAPPSRYGGVVGIAMQYLGVPYVWGGSSPSGFDCSGLVAYVYAQAGVSLPHNAAMQYGYGVPVAYSDLQAGDLVFFSGLGHVGIYVGGGQFVHAPHTGDVVKISSMASHGSYVGARRIL